MSDQVKIACKGAAYLDVDQLNIIQGNLKELSKENYDKLKKEILELGMSEPIGVWRDKNKNNVLSGTQRTLTLRAMRKEGFKIPKVPVSFIEAENKREAQKKILALTSQYGEITRQGLHEFMEDAKITFDDIKDSFRFPEISFDKFEEEFFDGGTEGLTDEDAVPTKVKAITKPGDLYILGNHRLLCGDSTSSEDVERLMDGEKADMVFTDPPYGVSYDGGHANEKRREKLANDDSTEIYDNSVPNMFSFSKPNSALYLWFAEAKSLQVLQVLQSNNYEIRSWLIWNKNMAQFGAIGAQYKKKHEPCLYCYKNGQTPYWNGPNNEISVWDISRASKNEYHPTQKPVELSKRAITNSCPIKGIVLDLFGGSGSTMIGAESTGRSSRLMELDPHYCDVIVERWENFTGLKAEKISGKTAQRVKDAEV